MYGSNNNGAMGLEEELELGMTLSDILSMDGESMPPTLPGTPNREALVPQVRTQGRQRVRLYQLEHEQEATTKKQQYQPTQRPQQQHHHHHHHHHHQQQQQQQQQNSHTHNHNHHNNRRHSGHFSPVNQQEQQQNSYKRNSGKRPASWGGGNHNWRGSDKSIALITCAGCNVQIPANQAVGHASQCNRLQGQAKKSSVSPVSSPRAGKGMKKGTSESFTSAYSLFIARELEGVKMKRDEVASSKWKEMTPAEKFLDLANRNRAMKETLLQRMTAATAKWEEMTYDQKKPFIDEAAKNRGQPASPAPSRATNTTTTTTTTTTAKRVSWSLETAQGKNILQNDIDKRVSWGPEDIRRWDSQIAEEQQPPLQAGADSSAAQLGQLAYYLAGAGLIPQPTKPNGTPDSSMQSMANASLSMMTPVQNASNLSLSTYHTVPISSWEVASATDSEDSQPRAPPSPTYATATAKLNVADPSAIKALLGYDSDDTESAQDSESEEKLVQATTIKPLSSVPCVV